MQEDKRLKEGFEFYWKDELVKADKIFKDVTDDDPRQIIFIFNNVGRYYLNGAGESVSLDKLEIVKKAYELTPDNETIFYYLLEALSDHGYRVDYLESRARDFVLKDCFWVAEKFVDVLIDQEELEDNDEKKEHGKVRILTFIDFFLKEAEAKQYAGLSGFQSKKIKQLFKYGMATEILVYISTITIDDKNRYRFANHLIDCYIQLNEYDKALKIIQSLDVSREEMLKDNFFVNSEDREELVRDNFFEDGIYVDIYIPLKLAEVYFKKGEDTKAFEEFDKVIRLSDVFNRYKEVSCLVLIASRNPDLENDYKKSFEFLCTKYKNDAYLNESLGKIFLDNGFTDWAIRVYERSAELAPDSCCSLINLGNIFYHTDTVKALSCYKRASKVPHDTYCTAAFTNMIYIYNSEKGYFKIIELFEEIYNSAKVAKNISYFNLEDLKYIRNAYFLTGNFFIGLKFTWCIFVLNISNILKVYL